MVEGPEGVQEEEGWLSGGTDRRHFIRKVSRAMHAYAEESSREGGIAILSYIACCSTIAFGTSSKIFMTNGIGIQRVYMYHRKNEPWSSLHFE